MFTSFSTALSALNAFSTGVDVVGNNLANLNTTGYKASTVSFHDMLTQGATDLQVGFGVGKPMAIRQFTQGAIQGTNNALDVAIQGDGFLVVKNAENAQLYTRGGHLKVDSNGFLLTATGERVQGWTAGAADLNTTGPIGDISLPVGSIRPPVATSSFSLNANLNANAVEGDEFSSSIEIFDSLGAPHLATVTFTKAAAAGSWDYSISVADEDVTDPVAPATGTLTFDSQGRLSSPAADDEPLQLEVAGWTNGAADSTLTWNLFDGLSPRLTQYTQPTAVAANSQDGSSAAQLVRVGIGDGGMVLAQYSNGTQSVVGQLAMANIRNPDSLVASGNNNFRLSAQSALPVIGMPGTGGRGVIAGGSIESSTVDIAREFTNLIVLQRGYQANAKVVTTVDEMSQETLNIKR